MNIGNRIKNLRQNKNITQQQLASTLFISDKTISSWEVNRTEPSLEMIIKLSETLDCTISYLVYGDNSKNDIETEIKIKLTLDEFNQLKSYMEKHANDLGETKQFDTYYQPYHRKFIDKPVITEWLRIGHRGNKNILTYKNWYDIHCDEYEIEFDNVENLQKIFKILELEEIATVNKTRQTYLYLDKYEVALDIVEKLGYFVEIEVKKYSKTCNEEYDDLIKIAKNLNLNLNNIDTKGYPYYLIKRSKYNGKHN